ncbi:hypothetical protein F2Q70_00010414 [Brassica cretica]|uniref:Uncharacterized protein n=1 Tax=Brassica cretica TaxID=69181 RepID=A0A8S9LVV4_BRACR|nr:hypothetical protein F2Q70_00010414 [Brassica cretica]
MFSLIIRGRKPLELHKWLNFRVSLNPSAFSSASDVSQLYQVTGLQILTSPPSLKLLLQDAESSLLTKVPKILGIKKDKALSRYYDFVREIIVVADKSYYSLPEGSAQGNKLRNVLVLRDMGVPQRLLLPLLISNHHVCCGKEKFEETLKKVVEMGFEPATFRFVEALRMLYHGRKPLELHKWRYMRASFIFLQNPSAFPISFSSASAAADVSRRKGNNFTLSYLVESLGFTTKLAESILRKVTTEDSNCNPDSVLTLLRSHGFTNSHISTIIRTYPRLLSLDSESSLAPKLRFLTSRGASTSELTEVLSTVPKILGIKKDKALSRYYDFVREIIIATDKSYYSLPEGSAQGNKLRNVLVLRDMGVPQRLLLPLLISNHHVCCGKEKFEETLKKVVEMGFEPATFRFVEALRMLYQLSDKTIREKLCFYGKLGFSVGDVWEMFKKNPSFLPLSEKNVLNSIEAYLGLGFTRDEFAVLVKCHPQCLNYSAELVKKKTEFLVKSMNWPVKALVSNPTVLGYNLEKRTIPRCNVIKALMSEGLLGSELPSLGSVLVCTDHAFLKRYVMKHGDDNKKLVAELMAVFTGGHVS